MRTCRACASTSEYTATGAMPISRQARMTRAAISPRLAISRRLNTGLVIVRHPQPGPLPEAEGDSSGVTAASQTGRDLLRLAGTAVYRGLTGMAHAWLAETPFVVVDLETTGGSA